MNIDFIRGLLTDEALKCLMEIVYVDEIDSTNAEVVRRIDAGKTENWVLVTTSQTAGRGRRGRVWLSPQGAGIYMSLVYRFNLATENLQSLSLLTAISLHESLSQLGVEGLQLKWPNDLLHGKKKLAGILLDLKTHQAETYMVFGVGINIDLPSNVVAQIDRPVTDINAICVSQIEQTAIVASLINRLSENLNIFLKFGFASFKDAWNKLDCYLGADIVIKNGETLAIGKSAGVDDQGGLLLESALGLRTINGGEIIPSLRELNEASNS